MKFALAFATILLASCSKEGKKANIPGREVFDEFQAVLVGSDFKELADRLDPEILRDFRRQLEFTTKYPRQGSWFTGTRDRQPTPQELASISDFEFFSKYMQGSADDIGNPFSGIYSDGELLMAIDGEAGYRHFIFTKDNPYRFPITFSFKPSQDGWTLVEPSIVEAYARNLRAATGGTTDG